MDRVRVGVIGTSWWVDLMYRPSLMSHPRAEVVAVCGRDPVRAGDVAAAFGGARVFTDYRDLIAEGGCDAVVIATPDDLHHDMALAAIDAGLHVLCEKPLACTHADADRMLAAARARGVKHMVLYTWRWQPHWRYVNHLLKHGYVGRCRFAEFRFLSSFALDPGYKWRFDGSRANGVVGDLGSHVIDFAQWHLGPVTAVRADLVTAIDQVSAAVPSATPANDIGFLTLRLGDGCRAEITVSATTVLADENVRMTASFYGDGGSLEIEHPYEGVRAGAVIRGARRGEPTFATMKVPPEFLAGGVDPTRLLDPYVKQSAGPRLFIDAILDDLPIEVDFAVGASVQKVVDAALLSSAEDRWITLG